MPKHHSEELYDVDVDGMLAHVGAKHRYAERIVDDTPISYREYFPQRVWKDARGVFDGANPAAVELGEVEAGTFWLIDSIVIEPGLATDLGFARVRVGSVNAIMRRLITVTAQGASDNMSGSPLYLPRGKVFVVCTQTTPGVSTVQVAAQIRVISIDG